MLTLGVIYLLLFIAELFLLSFLSGRLSVALGRLFFQLTRSERWTTSLLALVLLPGTIIHELSHILMAGITFVHVGEMDFTPQVTSHGVKLGSAQIGLTDPFRRSLIGVAPLIFGVGLIVSSLWLITPLITNIYLQVILFYIVFVIGNTMFSSRKDLEGLMGLVIALLVCGLFLGGVFWYFKIPIPFHLLKNIFNEGLVLFLQRSLYFLLLPLGLDLLILFLTGLFIRR